MLKHLYISKNNRIFAYDNWIGRESYKETYYPLVSKRLLDPFAEHLGILLFNMEEMVCRVCGKTKPLSEFEKLPHGYRRLCNDCRKEQRVKQLAESRKDPKFVENERRRGRESYWRNKVRGTHKQSPTPKFNCAIELRRRGIDIKGREIHHWNYNQHRSVFILDRYSHRLLHRYMYTDKETKFCYTKDGVRLETHQQAEEYFKKILAEHGFPTDIEFVDYTDLETIINKEIRWK